MKISVAMATYNGASFLNEQLESIARQTRQPHELIINDDGSNDGTREIISSFASKSTFPVYCYFNDHNVGSTINFDRAIGNCRGTHIALCDQDDVWVDGKLESLSRMFEANSKLGLAFSDALCVDEKLRPIENQPSLWSAFEFPADLPRLIKNSAPRLLLSRSIVTGATTLFSSQAINLARPFPIDIPHFIHDRWAATLVSLVMPIEALSEKLILYRRHSAQQVGVSDKNRDEIPFSRFRSNRLMMESALFAQEAMTTRLRERNMPIEAHVRRFLEERATHLKMRLSHNSGPNRFTAVAKSLFAGDYHRHSAGILSALKDLIA